MKSNHKRFKKSRTHITEAELSISERSVTESPNAGPVLVRHVEHSSFSDCESDVLTRDVLPIAQEVEHWQLDRLIPYARNPRTHSAAQIAQIAASIVEFGFTNPILVDTNGGIIAGHGRLLAARKLQLPLVPVILLNHLTETVRRWQAYTGKTAVLDGDGRRFEDIERERLRIAA